MKMMAIGERIRISSDRSGGESACWLWQGGIDRGGYGHLSVASREVRAHRVAYQEAIGEIPDGLSIDHLCHNADPLCAGGARCLHRRCVNPAHLEAVTQLINCLRGKSPSAIYARMLTCQEGHAFTEENTYREKGKRRGCRTCQREAVRRYRARKRADA